MKYVMIAMLVFVLTGCAGHTEYNPLGGATVTEVQPSNPEMDDHMIVIQAEIKRIVHAQGVKDAYLYWVINDAQHKDNMAVYDITITVEDLRQRFIFGLTDGKIGMVQEIEPEAEVDCQHEGQEYEGRKQA